MNPRKEKGRRRHLALWAAAVALMLGAGAGYALGVATNITVSQRTDGSGLVDIRYDVSGGVGEITVALEASSDNGATWTITPQAQYLSGDIGTVTNGTNKHIVWNGRAEHPGMCWPEMKVRLIITDEEPEPEITILLPGDVPLVLVWVPAGTFQMGRNPGEQDSYSDEDPQHEVTLSQGFYMGKYEVTQQQWLAVMGSWPGTAPSSENGKGNAYPAYYVSWNDAQNFITALNTHITNTGQGPATVRLPSEAEWEYACRAGTTTRFYFGDSLGCAGDCADCAAGVLSGNRTDYMWYCGNNSPSGTKPVGGKLPNAFGLYDMSGNVYEWCEDDWHGSYTGAPSNGSAWVDTPRGSNRVIRGGGWNHYFSNGRSAYRSNYAPAAAYCYVGFRLSR